jgi:hypothetical protein
MTKCVGLVELLGSVVVRIGWVMRLVWLTGFVVGLAEFVWSVEG